MEAGRLLPLLVFVVFFSALAGRSVGNSVDGDEYWARRAELARDGARAAYNPDPFSATQDFNLEVGRSLGSNATRRQLRGRVRDPGVCVATNPIDRCWRCRANWANHRKRLATCVKGFAHRTTGGSAGRFYVVTDYTDSDLVNPKPGTLRHAVIQKEPLWIVFNRSMVIRLSQELIMYSDKTIDGRGHNIHISGGAGITIQNVHNIIIHNIHIHHIVPGWGGLIRDAVDHYGVRTRSDGDGISIMGATNIWVDHVSLYQCSDGLIDAIQGSTAITLSNNHFTKHNDVILFGASDSYSHDQIMQVTVAFNHFGKGLIQRMPRCRWGFFHVVNNDYTHWQMYAVGGSQHPTILSQGNRYIAPNLQAAKEVTKRDYAMESQWKDWTWISQGDLFMNGAFFVQSGDTGKLSRTFDRNQLITMKPGRYVRRLTRYAGTLPCVAGKRC